MDHFASTKVEKRLEAIAGAAALDAEDLDCAANTVRPASSYMSPIELVSMPKPGLVFARTPVEQQCGRPGQKDQGDDHEAQRL